MDKERIVRTKKYPISFFEPKYDPSCIGTHGFRMDAPSFGELFDGEYRMFKALGHGGSKFIWTLDGDTYTFIEITSNQLVMDWFIQRVKSTCHNIGHMAELESWTSVKADDKMHEMELILRFKIAQ
jgi:hypothetical protein